VLRQEPSGRVTTPLEPLVLVATLAMIPIIILESDATGKWHTIAVVSNWLVWAVFAVEFAVILIGAPRKKAAVRAHWLDASIVVLTVPVFGVFLSSLRFVRLARLLRLARVGAVLTRALRAERTLSSEATFRFVALITLFLVVIGGAAQATFDAGDFHSVWDGVWWAVVTVTTVGYGDLVPHTVGGRLIGILVMFVGIGFVAVLTATVASQFVKADQSGDTSKILEELNAIRTELNDLRDRLPA
jgi:voltage-gated potassium channel